MVRYTSLEELRDDTGSVGQLDPNYECKLLDDDWKEATANQPGEIISVDQMFASNIGRTKRQLRTQ